MDYNSQNTIGWFRARLGNITGSAVGQIMSKPRSGDFTQTALAYLNQIAFERCMNPIVVNNDDLFTQYLSLANIQSKAIQWGHKMEGEAAKLFAKSFYKYFGEKDCEPYKLQLEYAPSVKCKDLPHFAASPDRMFFNPETGEECCLEIKCPQGKAFTNYVRNIFLQDTQEDCLKGLKAVEANYYWQVYAEMLATGASKTYFTIYNPFQQRPLYSIEVERDEDVLAQLRDRVLLAEEYISDLVNRMQNIA